ncbi:Chaperone DnaJ-domain superfamily protein [Euphorbia peplus]|nr:Chaperone DnaJ-domain superfamily protein [Euphorbia peplus]
MEGNNYRIEAERWLTIAEKLLAARDFQGAKTFAIRARESDPRLVDFADQIVSVADTIIAGELRIVNFNGGGNLDYYAILQLPRLSQSMELVATQYRKLALLLNPTRNRLSFADHAFRLVSEAWFVFSNPSKKAMYDNELQVGQLGQFGGIGQFGGVSLPLGGEVLLPGQQQQQQPAWQGSDDRSPRINSNSNSNRDGKFVVEEVPNRPSRFQSPPRITEPIRPIAQQPRQVDPVRPQPQLPKPAEPLTQTKAPEPVRATAQPVSTQPETNWRATQHASPQSIPPVTPVTQGTSTVPNQPVTQPVIQHTSPEPTRASRLVDVPIEVESDIPSFWTACPYCYILYEYPKVYEECAIRCQKLGYSGGKGGGGGVGNTWSPVSAMFATPFPGREQSRKSVQQKRPTAAPAPKVIYDDDVYINLSEPSEDESDSDDDWDESRKRAKINKVKSTPVKTTKRSQNERLKKAIMQNGAAGSNAQGDVAGKGEGSSGKKRGPKELGRLDLNVMFSNEVDEAVPGVSGRDGAGDGEEDNIEGIGFFEGLDEFLSSLPILSVVGDDKVKAS